MTVFVVDGYHRDSRHSSSPAPAQESALKINVQETADEAYKRRMMMSQQQLPPPVAPVPSTPQASIMEAKGPRYITA